MVQESTYLGFSVHWGMGELRKRLVPPILTTWATGFGREGRRGGIFDSDTEEKAQLSDLVIQCFSAIGDNTKYEFPSADQLIDPVVNLEQIFIHTIFSTGTSNILYHGDDERTPDNLNFDEGKRLAGDRFIRVEYDLLQKCRDEITELFPEIQHFDNHDIDDFLEWQNLIFLKFCLIDILVALRTDSRLLLFNPQPLLASAVKHLPAKKYGDLLDFFRLFEINNGAIAEPQGQFDLVGLDNNNIFGSREFLEYCESHSLLSSAHADKEKSIDQLSRTVDVFSRRFDKFVEQSTMGFLMIKSIEKMAEKLTSGISGDVKDFVEIVVRLCRDRERTISVYTGNNLEVFCEKILMDRVFGTVQKKSLLTRSISRVRSVLGKGVS